MKNNWYSITAKKGTENTKIMLYGIVGGGFFGDGVTAIGFIRELNAIKDKDIDVHISSPGGNFVEGLAIYNSLVAHKANITVFIDSLAGSIASVIAMAGRVVMPENTLFFIHKPSGPTDGTSNDHRAMADDLDKTEASINSIYAAKTGLEPSKLTELMESETLMTAAEAGEFGFADEVVEQIAITAQCDVTALDGVVSSKCIKNLVGSNPTVIKNAGISGKQPSQQEGNSMADITRDMIAEKHPEIANFFREEGRTEVRAKLETEPGVVALVTSATAAGAKGEHDRIAAVEAQLVPGHEAVIAEMVADGKTTGPEAAMRVVAAENAARKGHLDNLKADGSSVASIDNAAPDNVVNIDQNLPLEERCKAEWDTDPMIRAEFSGGLESFIACVRAEENNQVKVHG
jgi:ATP-dependent Clp protease protease subunit